MNEYELTVLIHPDLESNLDPALDKVRGLITNNGGEITKEDNWGKKKLAYPRVGIQIGIPGIAITSGVAGYKAGLNAQEEKCGC